MVTVVLVIFATPKLKACATTQHYCGGELTAHLVTLICDLGINENIAVLLGKYSLVPKLMKISTCCYATIVLVIFATPN